MAIFQRRLGDADRGRVRGDHAPAWRSARRTGGANRPWPSSGSRMRCGPRCSSGGGARPPGGASGRERMREFGMPVSAWMLDHAGLQPGQRVLELAAGPGETGFLAAELIRPGGTLICSDATERCSSVARARAAELGIDNVEFKRLELEWIDLPTASVDVVLCRWGVMFDRRSGGRAARGAPRAAAGRADRARGMGRAAGEPVGDDHRRARWSSSGTPQPPDPDAPGMFALARARAAARTCSRRPGSSRWWSSRSSCRARSTASRRTSPRRYDLSRACSATCSSALSESARGSGRGRDRRARASRTPAPTARCACRRGRWSRPPTPWTSRTKPLNAILHAERAVAAIPVGARVDHTGAHALATFPANHASVAAASLCSRGRLRLLRPRRRPR